MYGHSKNITMSWKHFYIALNHHLIETWLRDCNDHNSYRLKDCNTVINNSRKNMGGGGFMMQLKNNISIIEEFASELAESISVSVKVNNEGYIFHIVKDVNFKLAYTLENHSFSDHLPKCLKAIYYKHQRDIVKNGSW